MKSFRVVDGDMEIGASRRASVVIGTPKLIQDLSMWLLEPFGTGFTTPSFGSLLNSYVARDSAGRLQGAFVGRQSATQMQAEVEAEVDRVLNLYQQAQIQKIRQAQIDGRLYLYTRAEILDAINSVTSSTDADRAIVRASISTGNGNTLALLADMDEEPNIAIA